MSEPEKFQSRTALCLHLRDQHGLQVSIRKLMRWPVAELIRAHEEGHNHD